MTEDKPVRKKVGLVMNADVLDDARHMFKVDQCSCLSQFTERALDYYMGYIKSGRMTDYLSPMIMSSLKAASDENTQRITRILFKLAVEIAVMNNLYAASLDIDDEKLSVLRRECEKEVRKLNGDFGMENAICWQKR